MISRGGGKGGTSPSLDFKVPTLKIKINSNDTQYTSSHTSGFHSVISITSHDRKLRTFWTFLSKLWMKRYRDISLIFISRHFVHSFIISKKKFVVSKRSRWVIMRNYEKNIRFSSNRHSVTHKIWYFRDDWNENVKLSVSLYF